MEQARGWIREQVRRSSLQLVATQAGVSKATLHQFVRRDSPSTPTGRRKAAILAYWEAGRRSGTDGSVSHGTQHESAPAAETATEAELTGFQRGVLYAARAMSQRVTELLDEALGAGAAPGGAAATGQGGQHLTPEQVAAYFASGRRGAAKKRPRAAGEDG